MESKSTILIDLGNLSAPVGSLSWIRAVHEEAKAALNDAMRTREYVESWVGALLENDHYQKLSDDRGRPFLSWVQFCGTHQPFGLGYSPKAIDAIKASRPSVPDKADGAKTLAAQGRPEKTLYYKDYHPEQHGTSGDYLIARIARDRPDILERMKAGEFPSVRSAALEAGIVKPTMIVQVTPDACARAIRRHFTPEQIERLIELLED